MCEKCGKSVGSCSGGGTSGTSGNIEQMKVQHCGTGGTIALILQLESATLCLWHLDPQLLTQGGMVQMKGGAPGTQEEGAPLDELSGGFPTKRSLRVATCQQSQPKSTLIESYQHLK